MNWGTFALYVLTEATLSATPGPAVMLVVASGLARGGRSAVLATLGILTANLIYFAVSATSLGALLAGSYAVFSSVKWVGAAYLVYLGLSAILGKASPVTISARRDRGESGLQLYRAGVTLQLSNPKALLFFVAILPQFVDPRRPVAGQMAWLALGSVIPEFLILCTYGYLAGRASALAARPRFARWADRTAGALLLCAAALVARVGRS